MALKKMPILVQLIAMLLIVMVIPMTITVYYSSVMLGRYSEEEIADSVLAQLRVNSTMNEKVLFTMVQSVLSFAESSDLRNMRGIASFELLNSDYANIRKGLRLLSQLQSLQVNNEIVESATFIPTEWDYVVSSKKSIIRKEDYGDLTWFEEATVQMDGVSGYWYPRMEGSTPVITYLYRLNNLTTSLKGVVAVNIYEEAISTHLNFGSYKADSAAFMIGKDGTVLSHSQKDLLFQRDNMPLYLEEIKQYDNAQGVLYTDGPTGRMICAIYRPSNRTWTYGVTYPMKDLLAGMQRIRNKQILFMLIITGVGVVITLIYAFRFSRPMRQLARELKKKANWQEGMAVTNEIELLTKAFECIEKEEEELYLTLQAQEASSKKQLLHTLLQGEDESALQYMQVAELFPYNLFMVAVIRIDHLKNYLEKLDTRNRGYQRYLLIDVMLKLFPTSYKVQAIRHEGSSIAVIMNMEGFDQRYSPVEIREIFEKVQEAGRTILKTTLSIGISGVHIGYASIPESVLEAVEASNKKVFYGNECILFWEQEKAQQKKDIGFYYPYENLEKVQNYLMIHDLAGIQKELDTIEADVLKNAQHIRAENVPMIFNQLAGTVTKFMMKHQIQMGRIQGTKEDIYNLLSRQEILSDYKQVLLAFCEQMIACCVEEQAAVTITTGYSKQILDYLHTYYAKDILYEDLAEQIGISYSYLRRIVKEETGKSVSDYINKIRIEKMKELLVTTDLSLQEIGEQVGYRNMQSVTRYFKKFEGITPKEFRISQKA